MVDDPRLLPFPIASTTGELADANQIVLNTTDFNSNLLSGVADVQAFADAVDDLNLGQGVATTAAQVSVDDSTYSFIDQSVDNAQEGFDQLNRLFGIVQSINTQPMTFSGPFVPFSSSLTIDNSNFDTYVGRTALYTRTDDARVNFILPTEAVIDGNYPLEFSVLNQAGTGRFDTGATPTNTVIIDVQGANNIRRNTETGTLLNFIEAHQNDLVTLTRRAADAPWVATRVTLSSAALLLPNGLFHLRVGERISANPALGFLSGFNAGEMPDAGDAYRIATGNDTFGGYGIQTDDVIVALIDNPSRVISETNDDWLVIRNATNDIITLSEIEFLNTVTETDTFRDSFLMDRSDVSAARLWLSTGILDHAPFLTPSTDPNNPQGDGTRYAGGNEQNDNANDITFSTTDLTVFGEPAGSSIAPNSFVYFDIDGSFNAVEQLANVYMVIQDSGGNEIERHNAATQFRPITLAGSGDTYYVFDDVAATDNFSSINYHAGYRIKLVFRDTIRSFTLSSAVDVTGAIADGSLNIEKLEANVQALINADHSLTDAQETAVNGLITTGTPTVWTAGDLYVRDTNADPAGQLGQYFNVGQINGILPNYERTRDVTFVVPNFVTVTGLQRADDTSIKLSVTPLGTVSLQSGNTRFTGQGFTATLPAVTGAVFVGDRAWIVDGMASNLELTGAQNSFKVHVGNLGEDVLARTSGHPSTYTLPAPLESFNNDLTVTTKTASGWRALPSPYRTDLVRQAAALWTEDRGTFTGNFFEDLTGIEVIGFNTNNIFYYASGPNDPLNSSFPGAQSYILNDNVRIRNLSGQTTISDSINKVIGFNYALERTLDSGEVQSMVRAGPGASQPLLQLDEEDGLVLNIGRSDGGQRSRTYDVSLDVEGGHWHDRVDEVETAEAEVILSQTLTGSFEVRIDIQLDDNGNDEGTHSETLTITDVAADQNLGQRTFNYAGFPDITLNLVYEHDNNDLSNSRRVLFLRPVDPFTNAALTYNVAAFHRVTETWNVPTTYAHYPVNAGSGHDDFGLFDPHLYNTEHVRERNRVLFLLQPFRPGDSDTDPEMAVKIIVDGEYEGSASNDRVIRLHRPASDFTPNDWNFGNSICAISHIQIYDYDSDIVPSSQELMQMYNTADRWLGAFTSADESTDIFQVNGSLELVNSGGETRGIYLTSPNGTRHLISMQDNGTLLIEAV